MTIRAGRFLKRLLHHRAACIGVSSSFLLVVLALLGPLLAPYEITRADIVIRVSDRLSPPSPTHLLGTDHLGNDVLSLLLHGARLSVGLGVGCAFICTSGARS